MVLAASAGGTDALVGLFRGLAAPLPAAFLVVLHGPSWMLDAFAQRLGRECPMKVALAAHGERPTPGEIQIAPGERHLVVEEGTLRLCLLDAPPENRVRPSADPLFRSAAKAFGRRCVAVVLTGMGRDGAAGAAEIAAAGGVVLVQDPATAQAPSMPQAVIDSKAATEVVALEQMPAALERHVWAMSRAGGNGGVDGI